MSIIFVIGVVQAFFIEFILLNKKNKTLADKVLAVWMFFIGLHLFLFYLDYEGFLMHLPHVIGILLPLPLIHGPFLLIYINHLIDARQQFDRSEFLHFLPILICYLIMIPQFLMPVKELNAHIDLIETGGHTPFYLQILGTMTMLTGMVYIPWSLLRLRNHKKSLGENFSYKESIDLQWLRNLVIGMGIIWVAVIGTNVVFMYFEGEATYGETIIFSTVTLFVFLIGYFGIRQGRIFADPATGTILQENEEPKKYGKSSLKEGKAQQYLTALQQLMEQDKPHLEPKITLAQLARRLGITANNLSQVINEQLEQNFFDFINEYRVEEFKARLMADKEKKITLLGHALDSGFSSKSSFNEVFKKVTGQTPSAFQRQIKN